MQKLSIFIFLCVFSLLSCSDKSGDNFELKGKITGAENKKVILETMTFPSKNNPKFTALDTVTADEQGNFTVRHHLPERMICRISIEGDDQNYYIVSLKDEKLVMNADLAKLGAPDVEGSASTVSLYNFMDAVRDYDSSAMQLNDSITHLRSTKQDSLADAILTELQKNYYLIFKNYADTVHDISNAVIALESLFDEDFDYVKSYAEKAKGSADSTSVYVKELTEKVKLEEAIAAQTLVGKPFIDIVQPGQDGKDLKLSDLKGKIILIDFWASWCKPCRAENPNVVKVYNKYKSKNFTVFSVSLDNSKNAWINAIKSDGLIWNNHVAWFDSGTNKAAQDYSVSAIPMNFLVNEEGIIVAQNLRGAALDNAVKGLIK